MELTSPRVRHLLRAWYSHYLSRYVGYVIEILSFGSLLSIATGNPAKFAVIYSFGNVLALSAYMICLIFIEPGSSSVFRDNARTWSILNVGTQVQFSSGHCSAHCFPPLSYKAEYWLSFASWYRFQPTSGIVRHTFHLRDRVLSRVWKGVWVGSRKIDWSSLYFVLFLDFSF